MIKIFNANKELTLISKKQLDFIIEHELDNGDKTLTFFVPLGSKEAEVIEQEGYIQTKDQEYVIKEVNKNNNSFNIVAKLNLEDFEGKPHKSFESRTATIEGAINLAIVGTGWTVAYSNITKKRTVRKVKIDTLELIQHIKKIYNAELVFNALEKKIYIYDYIGSYKGAYVRENINLTQLSGQSNSYDFYTRVEAEGAEGLTFAGINNGKPYVEDYSYSNKVKTYFWKDERYTNPESLLEDARIKLEEMARPRFSYSVEMINLIKEGKEQQDYGLGDTIELVSKSMKVKELQRIVKLVEYPDTPEKNYVELSNTLYSLEDINNKFEDIVETVDNITNQDGTIDGSLVDSIETSQIKDLEQRVNSITADKATVGQINAIHAIIGELEATKASIAQLEALKIIVGEIDAGKANITDLSAINAIIEILQVNVGRIETLVNGNLSSENIQAGGITSDKLTIANGFITNAMIANLDVSKINAGDFSTNKFRIVSDSGKMLIADNTIQIRDNNRVRVQIGKDASNDYSMYVWDSAGKLMFDATGLKADGIKNKIIRDDMISDNANIDGSKINISSLITEINKDTNTTVIKSSKVQLDTLGQTLDVAFNSLKSNVDNMEIGGRNLWIKSKTTGASAIEYLGENHITGQKECYKLNNGATLTFNIEPAFSSRLCRKVTFSAWVKYENVVQGENNWNKFNCFKHALLRKNSLTGATTTSQDFTTLFGFTGTSDWKRITSTYDYTFNGYDQLKTSLRFNIEGAKSGTAWVTGIKVELGDKATDYSDALEDVDSSIESVKQITESNSTTISVMQGQIATAINNTQIVKDGQTVLLKDDYNRTVAKVDSINSTIGTHTTKINDLTGSITNVDTKVNSVQRDLEGTKSTVSSHSTSITDLSSKVSTQGTSISQLQNQIKLKVESTEVNTIVNGAISKTAKSLDVMYYLSTSATSLAGGSWSTTAPTWTNGKYMWSKTVTTFVDGSKKESSPTCIAGATGANGSAGKGIKSIVEQYYLSISNTTQTGGSWVTSPPAWANGKYMWTRSIITYTDNSTTTTNPVCVSGSKGDTGAKGDKGATGAKGDTGVGISSVDVEYYLSTSATSLAGGSWSTTAPAWVNGKYMWSRTKTVTTTGATTYSNPVCITGAKGATGATGTKGDKGDAGATGQGISSITEEYYLSTSKLSQTGGSWVTTPPTWSTGKYMWTRSKIVYKNPTSTAYTTPVCDSNWEAVNEVQVGGRNLIKDSNFIVQATASAFATTKPVVLVSGLDLNAIFLGKTVSFSYFVHNVGSKQNGSGSLGSRFGIHGSIQWKNSSTGATTTYYPFAECLDGVYKNTRVSMKYTFNPPSGYDTIAGFSFSFQPLSRPGSGNAEIWKIGQPKLEIGNKATDWSPAPEDVDTSIANVQTQITNTSNKVATIETNLNSITQRVSSTESTVSTHTSQLSTVDSRINTAKNSAISTAASDATTKANNAQTNAVNSAKSYTDGQITTVNKTITNKVAEIKATTDSITQRVSSTESKITTITTDFNNLKIGGTNLATETNKGATGWGWSLQTGGKTATEVTENGIRCCKLVRDSVAATGWSYISYNRIGRNKYLPNRKYTVSFEVKASVVTSFYVGLKEGNSANPLSGDVKTGNTVVNTWTKLSATITTLSTLPSSTSQVLYLNGMNSGTGVTYIFRNLKIEEGTKESNWSPAPEDVDTSIANVQTQITNTSNKVATIETNLNSITSRVSSTETKVTTINGNITSLQSRMNTAEQKITPTAITTTISSTISGGTGSISTTQFVMDKNGLTINNGALIIKNKAGKTVLSSDSNGNLLYTGALYAQVDSSHYAKIEPILTNNNKDVKLRLSLVGNTEHSNFDVVNAAGVRLFKVGHGGVEIHKYLTLDTDQTGTYNTRCYWENGTYRPAVAEKALIGTNTYYFNSVFSRYFGRDRISGSYTTVQAGAVNIRTAYQGEGCYFDTDGYFRPAAQGAWANGHPSYRWSTLYSVNGVNASSDLRLKENVEYIQETNGISRLSSKGNNITQEDMYNFIKDEFKLASYNYKGEKFEGNTELSYNLGFIAQDLKDSNVGRQFIIPPQEEEGAYSYNMGSYIGVLAGALRIAINKIESLENRIKVLESKGA